MKKNIILTLMLILIGVFVLSACTNTNLNNENKETKTINIVTETPVPKPEHEPAPDIIETPKNTEEIIEKTFEYSSESYIKNGMYCTKNNICFEEYEDFLEKELEIYAENLTREFNKGKDYEVDVKIRLIDPLFNPKIKKA